MVYCEDNNGITFYSYQKGKKYTYKELIIQFLKILVLSIQKATKRKVSTIMVAFPEYMMHNDRKEIATVLSNHFNITVNDYNQIALASSLYLNKSLSKDMIDYSLCCMDFFSRALPYPPTPLPQEAIFPRRGRGR